MATVNIGNIKFTWKGAYNASTAYAVDDIVSNDGSSYVCILASTGNLPTNVDYLVVAGGGGGGTHVGGGGGAGGLLSNHPDTPAPQIQADLPLSTGNYTVTIGAGGAGGSSPGQSPPQTGGAGGNSVFGTVTSTGGGGGGDGFSNGATGGSAGGWGHGPGGRR